MIRVAIFLAIVCLVALGVAWIADRPGDVSVVWLGWRIETSLMVLLAVIVAAIAGGMLLWSIVRNLWHSPRHVATALRNRRHAHGQRAIMRGLIAVGAGDARAARRHAEDVQKIAPLEPLALLLAAQSAQLGGDRAGAERAFRQMTAHASTKLLGLRGLFIEAQRNNDISKARLYAEEAAKIAPSLPWAGQAVLQLRCATGDWRGALEMLERNRASGALERASFRRKRAVLLTAHALSLEDSDRDTSKALAFEAVKHAPDLVPAVALVGALPRRGRRVAQSLAHDGARLAGRRRIPISPRPMPICGSATRRATGSRGCRNLRRSAPDNVESALALARAAIDAREFELARRAMSPFLSQSVAASGAIDVRSRTGRIRRTKAAPANGPRVPYMPRATRSGLRTALCRNAGCRFRR